MKLLAWKAGREGSQWHIEHFGKPLCGTPVPDRPVYTVTKTAKPSDFARTCARCRELAVQAATGNEEPADRGKAIDGPNGQTGTAGPVRLEDTVAGQERAIT